MAAKPEQADVLPLHKGSTGDQGVKSNPPSLKGVESGDDGAALQRFRQHVAVCPSCSPLGFFLCADGVKLQEKANLPQPDQNGDHKNKEPVQLVRDSLPYPYESVRIWHEDGSHRVATWTGRGWWDLSNQLHPTKWQRIPRDEHTGGGI